MNYNVSIFAIFTALAAPAADPEIPFFTNLREVRIAAPDRQGTQLGSTSLYDFTREALGSNSVLKLPTTSFRYLHVRIAPGTSIPPKDVKAAAVYNLREQKARWTKFGSCGTPKQLKRST